MLELYIKLVESGKRTVESIPAQFREAVKEALKKAKETDPQ